MGARNAERNAGRIIELVASFRWSSAQTTHAFSGKSGAFARSGRIVLALRFDDVQFPRASPAIASATSARAGNAI